MDTEKSIKLMNVIKSILPDHYNFDFGKPEIDKVIKRLQMWEDYKKEDIRLYHSPIIVNDIHRFQMEKFEQKYLSKPKIERTIKVEVVASNERVISELAGEIQELNGQNFRSGKICVQSTRWMKD